MKNTIKAQGKNIPKICICISVSINVHALNWVTSQESIVLPKIEAPDQGYDGDFEDAEMSFAEEDRSAEDALKIGGALQGHAAAMLEASIILTDKLFSCKCIHILHMTYYI